MPPLGKHPTPDAKVVKGLQEFLAFSCRESIPWKAKVEDIQTVRSPYNCSLIVALLGSARNQKVKILKSNKS